MIITLILLAAFVAVVQLRASSREQSAETTYPPVGQIIEVDGVPVHAFVAGKGPDLVLIHGASGNLREFTFDMVDRLTDRYRVIAFDRPGLGWTGRLPSHAGAWNSSAESPFEQAALLQKAADDLGVESPIVLGHSFGGAVAIAWSLSRPDSTAATVLLGSVSNPWEGDLGLLYQVTSSAWGGALVIPPATAFLPENYVRNSIGTIFEPQSSPEGYDEYVGSGLTLRRESIRANAQQVNGLFPHILEMQQQYSQLKMPIELVHGDKDTIVPAHVHAQVFVTQVPSANLTLLPGVGHMPHHANPVAVMDAIDRAAGARGFALSALTSHIGSKNKVLGASMDLPFDGAISAYFENDAPADIRGAIERGEKGDILTSSYPHSERLSRKAYEKAFDKLQIEMVKLQSHARASGLRIAMVFEGRDAAGKGGTISRMRQNLNPRAARVVALTKPTETEQGEWYFQRYIKHLPSDGEMVFFDRSWYNRGVVEDVFGFCTDSQREHFFAQVQPFEQMLVDDGIHVFKFWLNVCRAEQLRRMLARESDPLKQWKLSGIDVKGLAKWEEYTDSIRETLTRSHSENAPWTIIRSDDKRRARLNAMRVVLQHFNYPYKNAKAIGEIDSQICGGPDIWDA